MTRTRIVLSTLVLSLAAVALVAQAPPPVTPLRGSHPSVGAKRAVTIVPCPPARRPPVANGAAYRKRAKPAVTGQRYIQNNDIA